MALAKKCDRCGKLYEYTTAGLAFGKNGTQGISTTGYDLCQRCMDEFDAFVAGLPVPGLPVSSGQEWVKEDAESNQ